ncbi:hypothetical protein PTKIN_Ptkin14bG0187700 [Pterospermum kingtungense]
MADLQHFSEVKLIGHIAALVFFGVTQKERFILGDENGGLYANARTAPISLTYYAFCLANATYTVKLHFAEIQFTNDQNYSSLGRRIFDVYIQGKLVLKDFNIMNEAGGAGIPIVKNFTVNVTDGTLEIQLRWAGKGTISIPVRGVYGPCISAISVFDPAGKEDYKPPSGQNRGGISTTFVVGVVAGAVFATFLLLGILWWYGCLRRERTLEQELKGIELQTSSFTLRQIKAATKNFDAADKIGEGGFGPVYKGVLADGTVIAVKQLSARSKQGNCPEKFQLRLDWSTRWKICIGIARGLAYLHEESRLKIVHRDIKATNVLLDKNLNPKISDFGLAKLHEEDNTHISTRIAGTYGYMAPEYALHGHLTDKADVYSFGIVALEIVSGKCNTKHWPNGEFVHLLDWAHILKEKGKLLDLIDPRIGCDCNIEDVQVMMLVAFLCTNPTAAARPSMSFVVSMLEGRAAVEEFIAESSSFKDELCQEIEENEDRQTMSMLGAVGSWTSSFTAAADLYPVSLTSTYWQNRDSSDRKIICS